MTTFELSDRETLRGISTQLMPFEVGDFLYLAWCFQCGMSAWILTTIVGRPKLPHHKKCIRDFGVCTIVKFQDLLLTLGIKNHNFYKLSLTTWKFNLDFDNINAHQAGGWSYMKFRLLTYIFHQFFQNILVELKYVTLKMIHWAKMKGRHF